MRESKKPSCFFFQKHNIPLIPEEEYRSLGTNFDHMILTGLTGDSAGEIT